MSAFGNGGFEVRIDLLFAKNSTCHRRTALQLCPVKSIFLWRDDRGRFHKNRSKVRCISEGTMNRIRVLGLRRSSPRKYTLLLNDFCEIVPDRPSTKKSRKKFAKKIRGKNSRKKFAEKFAKNFCEKKIAKKIAKNISRKNF